MKSWIWFLLAHENVTIMSSPNLSVSPPDIHSSHPKCFQIMNIQIVEFDCYLHERTVPILPSSIIKKKSNISTLVFPYFVSIFVQNNKNQKRDRIWKSILKSWIWFLLAHENYPYSVLTKFVRQSVPHSFFPPEIFLNNEYSNSWIWHLSSACNW